MKRGARFVAAAVTVGLLGGCDLVGPDYHVPTMNSQAQFFAGGTTRLEPVASEYWWERIGDPVLDDLVNQGIGRSFDIKIALERIAAAQAITQTVGLNQNLIGDVSISGNTEKVEGFRRQDNSTAIFGARYVLDVFGGARRADEEALANLDATRYDTGVVRLAYLAELVSTYINARYNQEAMAVANQSVRARRRTLAVVRERVAIQNSTVIDVSLAQARLSSAEARVLTFKSGYEDAVFRIATLLDKPASDIAPLLSKSGKLPNPSGRVSTGIPADLLRNRPDIHAAERRLAASVARVGVTEAALYPSVQVTGVVTAASANSFTFGPEIRIPVLNRPVLLGNRKVAESRAREAELTWRRAVSEAVQDVQTGMSRVKHLTGTISALSASTNSFAKVLSFANDRFEVGEVTLIEVQDAQRDLFSSQQELLISRRSLGLRWVELEVALGKGWLPKPEEPVQFAPARGTDLAQTTTARPVTQ